MSTVARAPAGRCRERARVVRVEPEDARGVVRRPRYHLRQHLDRVAQQGADIRAELMEALFGLDQHRLELLVGA